MSNTSTVDTSSVNPGELVPSVLQGMRLQELNGIIRGMLGDDVTTSRSKDDAIERIQQARKREARMRRPTEGTLRAFAEEQLKSGPLTYSQVLKRVKERFPACHTSRSSLRWYASQMRARGDDLPERPIDTPQ